MRSPTAGRRRRSRPTPGARLAEVLRLVVEGSLDGDCHVAFHIVDLGDAFDLGLLELPEGVHPFTELAGMLAPSEWDAIGLVVRGRARHLEGAWAPYSTVFGFGVDRKGHEASVGVLDDELVDLPGRAVGTIPDLCRRMVDRPTDPAPPTTTILWLTQWLSRLHDTWQDQPEHRRELTSSWPSVSAFHPSSGGVPVLDPDTFVHTALDWAAEHPWSAVRTGVPLELPDGPLPVDVASWMDDGFFARWVLGAYPSLPVVASELVPLLAPSVKQTVQKVVIRLLDPTVLEG